jgi:hypothetical protein
MALDAILRKSKSFIAVPLLSLALTSSLLYSKDYNINSKIKDTAILTTDNSKTLEDYTIDYDVGVYLFGIKFFSADADFSYQKIEENGIVKEFMGINGRYSRKYYARALTFFSKDDGPFERQSYSIRYDKETYIDETSFYNDKIVFVKDGLEGVVANDGCIGLQSVLKPLLTEDLYEGQAVYSKTFLEGKRYNCEFIVKKKEDINIKGKDVSAYHVTLKAVGEDLGKEREADLWIVKGTLHNKIVKVSLAPFIFVGVVAVTEP